MRILVTGAAGMLGSKMMSVLGDHHEVAGTDVRASTGIVECDITRAAEVERLLADQRPDVVIHCAAWTAVDDCESDPETAFRVNSTGTRHLAIACEAAGAAIFYISTDYVFDGEKAEPYLEHDPTGPATVYGRSKLAGERAVRDFCSRWTIGRIQWLYGEGGPNFVETMLRLAEERPTLTVVDDQRGSPTYTGDVARQAELLVEARAFGLYHMSNRGDTTWYGFARAVFDRAGKNVEVVPCTTEEFPRPAPRPKNSVMRNLELELTIGDSMRPWEEALEEYMEVRGA